MSVLVLAEAVWVLGAIYNRTREDQAAVVQMLLEKRDLVLENREAVTAALDLFQAKPSLGFSDCLVIESARNAGHIPLGTFDRALAKVPGAQKL